TPPPGGTLATPGLPGRGRGTVRPRVAALERQPPRPTRPGPVGLLPRRDRQKPDHAVPGLDRPADAESRPPAPGGGPGPARGRGGGRRSPVAGGPSARGPRLARPVRRGGLAAPDRQSSRPQPRGRPPASGAGRGRRRLAPADGPDLPRLRLGLVPAGQ